MFESCRAKQEEVKRLFASAVTPEGKYQVLMDLGKRQVLLAPEDKTENNRVRGCQSITYLKATLEHGKSYFQTESDALISAGLGQILTMVYSGEAPEVVLKCPPTYLEELGIYASLSPGRANGLSSIFIKIKQQALKHYILLTGQ
jgi:cysteine desulfuration protein SufE